VPEKPRPLLRLDPSALLALAVPGAQVAECVPRAGGQLSMVYEARFADGTDPVIIKVYAPEWEWKQAKEAHVYGLLRSHGFGPVARILGTGSAPDGRAYTVMTCLPGEPLSESAARMTADEIGAVYRQMGSALADLHRIDQEAFGYLVTGIVDAMPTNSLYMTRQFAKKLGEFASLGGDAVLRAEIERHVAERSHLFGLCQHAVLCHNDFHEGNVLVARDDAGDWRVSGVVDVENMIAADPLVDLAKTDCYSIRGDQIKRAALLAGYGPAGEESAERLAVYGLYHNLELWDWFASIGRTDPLDDLAHEIGRRLAY
jgi:hygromycin-B 7''-O-kinase